MLTGCDSVSLTVLWEKWMGIQVFEPELYHTPPHQGREVGVWNVPQPWGQRPHLPNGDVCVFSAGCSCSRTCCQLLISQ